MRASLLLRLSLLAAIATASQLSAQAPAQESIVPNRYLVVYRNGIVPYDADQSVQSMGAKLLHLHRRFGIATIQTPQSVLRPRIAGSTSQPAIDDQAVMRRLASQSNVAYVLHDRLVTAHHITVRPAIEPVFSVAIGTSTFDTFYNSPQGWAVRQVGGFGASVPGGPAHGPWDTTKGRGVRIAILDSGVDATHPDIIPNLALHISEVDQTQLPSPCDDGSPQDQAGHGTWTASLAAAALGPNTGKTVGVAPQASILSIKVLQRMPAAIGASDAARCTAGEASGLLSWVIDGIDDALANNADVISMSLGTLVDLSTGDGAGIKATFDQITYAASQSGAVLIAAAGNNSYDLTNPRYMEIPAQSRNVLAVTASTNPACVENSVANAACVPGAPALASYSNFGATLNAVAAPGGNYPEGDEMAVSGWVRGACSSGLPSTADGLPTDAAHSFGCFSLGHAAY
ncbi:MAG TPA: S8 family serine peptidase, partial [Edaphobacter sp.]